MSNLYEDMVINVHKPNSTPEEYLVETANWEKEIEQLLKEPAFTMPSGMTREERREWVRKCAEGEIEPDA